jgi:hypothetical protein
MTWSFSGEFIESCSCNLFCPCWYTVPEYAIQDQGWCATTVGIHVREGAADGVSLSGQTVVVAFDFPELMFLGGGTGRVYVDDGATPEQQRALGEIFTGQVGGPIAALAPMIATWLPVHAAHIELREDGDAVSVSVSGIGSVETKTLRDAGGNDFRLSGGGFVGGLQMESVTLAPSNSHWSDPDMPRVFDTKSGGRAAIRWNG